MATVLRAREGRARIIFLAAFRLLISLEVGHPFEAINLGVLMGARFCPSLGLLARDTTSKTHGRRRSPRRSLRD